MTELILAGLLAGHIAVSLVERNLWAKERAHLIDAAVARTPGELVALRATAPARKRKDDNVPSLPPPIGL